MAQATLVGDEIDLGIRVGELLEQAGVEVVGLFWLYSSEEGGWRLVVCTPLYEQAGLRQTYARIREALEAEPELADFSLLSRITAISPTDPLYVTIRSALHLPGPGFSKVRFTNNTINTVWIEDALVYRVQ